MTRKPAPMADDVLSEEDKNMLSYFWEAKGDLER